MINITRVLWVFDIGYKYENGVRQDIDPLAMTQGFNSRLMPFEAVFRVGSAEIQAVKDIGAVLENVRLSIDRKT